MASVHFDGTGDVIGFFQSPKEELTGFGTGFVSEGRLEFDPRTNPQVFASLVSSLTNWTVEDGVLKNNGSAVALHPPGPTFLSVDELSSFVHQMRAGIDLSKEDLNRFLRYLFFGDYTSGSLAVDYFTNTNLAFPLNSL